MFSPHGSDLVLFQPQPLDFLMALPLQLVAFFFISLDLEAVSTFVVFLCGVPVNTPPRAERRLSAVFVFWLKRMLSLFLSPVAKAIFMSSFLMAEKGKICL
jgi:hypothetical protein